MVKRAERRPIAIQLYMFIGLNICIYGGHKYNSQNKGWAN
jgi:hypothetical protein